MNLVLNPSPSLKPALKLAFCSHEAAYHAVTHWHYSRSMPRGKLVRIGVWKDDKFIGCVLFGRGANNNLGKPYNLEQTECCELVRVALSTHVLPVTAIISRAIVLLKRTSPGLKLIISYADPEHKHLGIIYQAGNWIYAGQTQPDTEYYFKGKRVHRRTLTSTHGSVNNISGLVRVKTGFKFKYLYPLDKKTRKAVLPLSLDYPKSLD